MELYNLLQENALVDTNVNDNKLSSPDKYMTGTQSSYTIQNTGLWRIVLAPIAGLQAFFKMVSLYFMFNRTWKVAQTLPKIWDGIS